MARETRPAKPAPAGRREGVRRAFYGPAVRGASALAPIQAGRRDLAIDFLRGAALVVMVVNHLVGASWVHAVTFRNLYVTAAEAFVFCSALVLGMLTRRRLERDGAFAMLRKTLGRAALIYLAAVALIVVFGTIALVAPGWARPTFLAAPPGGFWGLVTAAATFRLAPPVIDILPLYVHFLLIVPALAFVLARGWWLPLLFASLAIWAVNWAEPYALSSAPLDRGGRPYFAFASWQLLFVATFVAGWHREALLRAWAGVPRLGWVLSLGTITVMLAVAAHYDAQLGAWPTLAPDRESWLAATDRSLLGPVRLLACAALFPLLLMGIRAAWARLDRLAGGLLLPLGQNSLYVYIMHVPLVVLWTVIVAPSLGGNALMATIGQVGTVALLWYMVQRRFLFRWVPR